MRSPQTVSLVYVLRLHSSSKGHFCVCQLFIG